MRTGTTILLTILGIFFIIGLWAIMTYNSLVGLEEEYNTRWSNVENQYQRRYDLIPNLVEVVKGYAKHEKETFKAVTEARAKAGGTLQLNASDLTPEKLAAFQQAQQGLAGALSRLMVVVEKYPELKASQNFSELQAQLEGTENRIAVARRDFNKAAKSYNKAIRRFPGNIIARMGGFEKKPYFQMEQGADKAPKVKF